MEKGDGEKWDFSDCSKNNTGTTPKIFEKKGEIQFGTTGPEIVHTQHQPAPEDVYTQHHQAYEDGTTQKPVEIIQNKKDFQEWDYQSEKYDNLLHPIKSIDIFNGGTKYAAEWDDLEREKIPEKIFILAKEYKKLTNNKQSKSSFYRNIKSGSTDLKIRTVHKKQKKYYLVEISDKNLIQKALATGIKDKSHLIDGNGRIKIPPDVFLNSKYEIVKASEYYNALFIDRFKRRNFYSNILHKQKIPFTFASKKGKRNEYTILVDDPDILEKIRLKRKMKVAIKNLTRSFYVSIPEHLDVFIKNTMSSPLAFFYKEFFSYLESNKDKVTKEVGKYARKRVRVSQSHYDILSNYSKELNIKLTDLVPILIKLFFEHRQNQ